MLPSSKRPLSLHQIHTLWLSALSTLTPLTIPSTIRTFSRILLSLPRSSSNPSTPILFPTEISSLYTNIAILRSFLGEFWLAKHIFYKALSYNPSSIFTRYCLGICMFQLQEYRAAAKEFRKCLRFLESLGSDGKGLEVEIWNRTGGECGLGWGAMGKVWVLEKADIEHNMLASRSEKDHKAHLPQPSNVPSGINGIPAGVIFAPNFSFSVSLPPTSPLLVQLTQHESRTPHPMSSSPPLHRNSVTPNFSAAFTSTWRSLSLTKPLPPLPPPTPLAKAKEGRVKSWCDEFYKPQEGERVARAISPSFREIRASLPELRSSQVISEEDRKSVDEERVYETPSRENSESDSEKVPLFSYERPIGQLPGNESPSHKNSYTETESPKKETANEPLQNIPSRPASTSPSIDSILSLYDRTPLTSKPSTSSTYTQTPPTAAFTPSPPSHITDHQTLSVPPQTPSIHPLPQPHHSTPKPHRPHLTLSTSAAEPHRPVPAYKLMSHDFSFLPLTKPLSQILAQEKRSGRASSLSQAGGRLDAGVINMTNSRRKPINRTSGTHDTNAYPGRKDGKGLAPDGGEILLPRVFEGFAKDVGDGSLRRVYA